MTASSEQEPCLKPATTELLPPEAIFDRLHAITQILAQATGHDFSHYKQTTLQRRIDFRMQLLHLNSLDSYQVRLQQDHGEVEQLFQDLLIRVTEFFRDREAFEALAATVIPNLLRNKGNGLPLRVWVPGCASGEEAYSLAMLIYEQISQLEAPPPVQIFATDIDEAALAHARQGLYGMQIAQQVTREHLARYFVLAGTNYQIANPIREMCLFSVHNLISDPPFGRMDLISCRNLLIYFDSELQRQLISVFHYALNPGGYLFLGSAESALGASLAAELFRVVDGHQRIYQRKDRLSRPQLALPWAGPIRSAPRLPSAAFTPRSLGVSDLGAMLAHIINQDYAPTAAVIDQQGSIVYLSGRTYPYFSVPEGFPNSNLLDMIHPDLRLPLRVAMRAAAQEARLVVREDLTLNSADGQLTLVLSVRPLSEAGTDAGLLLVVLQTVGPPIPVVVAAVEPALIHAPVDVLAQDLQRTRATLEATISDLQKSSLDLMSANEDLRSLNEELHAAKEELQTSKEEIQSINEELETVNIELNHKIEEVDRANADLLNLFASIQIPALFLHGDGRIARFTPQATELFALIETDIGRSITDLNARFRNGDLRPLITQVMQTLRPIEQEVYQPESDRWWTMRIRLYRTLANTVDGVVITFADITTLKRPELVLQQSRDALATEVAERTRSEQERQQLIEQMVSLQEEERQRISGELHDTLGQDLTALLLIVKSLQTSSIGADARMAERIKQIQMLAQRLIQKMRDIAVQLRPSALDTMGLELALRNYVDQWAAQAKVKADLHMRGLQAARLSLAVEATIYRLVQEGLTNVFKHAQAAQVSIIIERQSDEVRVIIEDNGVGFAVTTSAHVHASAQQLGLSGMQARVTLLGGTLQIESSPGSGTTIFARLPLRMV